LFENNNDWNDLQEQRRQVGKPRYPKIEMQDMVGIVCEDLPEQGGLPYA